MKHMTPKEVKALLDQAGPSPFLLDVREPWEFETCHIEGSTLIPMGQIPQRFEELDSEQETVVICHHGRRSLQIAEYLEHAGFTNLINLTGGIDAWSHDVDPNMPTY